MTQAAILAASGSPGTTTGFKNKIINGNMVIDQRNAGASSTPSVADVYTVDRWHFQQSQNSKFTIGQNLNSVTPPTGFNKYLGFQTASAFSVGAGDYFRVFQSIEGNNISDLAWGTANAKSVTLSFWVYSSLTGSFGGAIQNSAGTASYPFSYSIPTANTWAQITISLPGPTFGTWPTDNTNGLSAFFSLGTGSNYTGTPFVWAANNTFSATGTVSVVANASATWYITGVQLEVGTTATNFDFRSYGTELQLCQRYFASTFSQGTAPSNANGSNSNGLMGKGSVGANGEPIVSWQFPSEMRTAPTVTTYNPYTSGTVGQWGNAGGGFGAASGARIIGTSTRAASVDNTGGQLTGSNQYFICLSATAEL